MLFLVELGVCVAIAAGIECKVFDDPNDPVPKEECIERGQLIAEIATAVYEKNGVVASVVWQCMPQLGETS